MASAPAPTLPMATYSSLISIHSLSALPPPSSKSQISLFRKRKHYMNVARSRVMISCKASNNDSNINPTRSNAEQQQQKPSSLLGKLDRRNVLIGLGGAGLYGATGLDPKPFASAAPVPAPDLTTCDVSEIKTTETILCCPPTSITIKTFTPPSLSTPLRIRPAAHALSEEYLAKFKEAQKLMRALPEDDPRSFAQQAKVHCAYCNGAYPEPNFPDIDIQVHYSWLFFPFHRLYLYFYERILAKLIDDPTFALPFWNWDSPAGMQIPSIYNDPTSPLYDQFRNFDHLPPATLDLDYAGTDDDVSEQTLIDENLSIMHREMVTAAKIPTLFFGHDIRAGDSSDEKYMGTIERVPHIAIHRWIGDPTQSHDEDMGNFYSAGRDPLFYAHHANVDRMWSIWKTLPGGKRKDFTDRDWLDAEFLFYDENAELVSCKVQDCLDTMKQLRYAYEEVSIPWLFSKPVARKTKNKAKATKNKTKATKNKIKATASATELVNKFPATLESKVTVEVARPKASKRSKKEKEKEEEVLVISGIVFDSNEGVKFDVYINDNAESLSRKDKSEFAGSFSNVPHKTKGKGNTTANLKLGISDLLEDLGVEDERSVPVTLVPRVAKDPITIGGLKIEFAS